MSTQRPGSPDDPDSEQQEQLVEIVIDAEPPPSLLQQLRDDTKTPIFGVPVEEIFGSDKTKTPVVIGSDVGRRIASLEIPLFDNPERQKPEMAETFRKLDELFGKNATSQVFYDEILELMTEADSEKAQKIWEIGVLYLREIVDQAFNGIERKLNERYSEQEIISAFQYCWHRVISKEGKQYILEKTRALIQKSDNKLKTQLFWGLVVSIINSLHRNDEEPMIELPQNLRSKFPHAQIAEKVSPTKLLPIDESYTQIQGLIEPKFSPNTRRNDRVVLARAHQLLEQNPLLSDFWVKATENGNPADYIAMCHNLYKDSIREIDKISEAKDKDGMITLEEETVELYERAWNEVIYPRLLIWAKILYSDLLLPEQEKAAA